MGLENLATPIHFVLGPKHVPRREKCPRTYDENPNSLEMLLSTILSSTFQNPEWKNGTPSEAASQGVPRRKDEYSRTHTEVWCRSSSRKNCHLRI